MSKPPGRPKSDDPKVAVTLRLPRSFVATYQAMGDGWRAAMEADLVGDPAAPHPLMQRVQVEAALAKLPKAVREPVIAAMNTPAPPTPHVNRLKGVWKPK